MRFLIGRILIVCLFSVFCSIGLVYAKDSVTHKLVQDVDKPIVRVGMFAFRDKAETAQRWQPLFNYLNQQLPQYQFEPEYLFIAEFEEAIKRRQFQFIFTNPSHYVLLTHSFSFSSPLATLMNNEDGVAVSAFGGVMVTLANRQDINQTADLKNKTIAIASRGSFGGYQMQAFELQQRGIDPLTDVRLLEVGMPQLNALQAVQSGKADVAFVRTGELENSIKIGKIENGLFKMVDAQLRPHYPFLSSTRLYPEWPFAALPDTDVNLAREMSAALLSLPPNGAVAQAIGIAGFTIPNDYRSIDELLYRLHLPPYNQTRLLSFGDIWQRWQAQLVGVALVVMLLLLWFTWYLIRSNRQLKHAQKVAAYHAQQQEIEHQHLKTLVNTLPDLVWVKDAQGKYVACNRRFEGVYGLTETALVGKSDYDFSSSDIADQLRFYDQLAIEAGKASVNEELIVFMDGHQELCETTKSPMYDAQGHLLGVLGIAHDITARKATENALKQSEDMLNRAQSIARLGSWYFSDNMLTWSVETYRIFGVSVDIPVSYDFFFSHVYEADRQILIDAWQCALTGTGYDIQHRIVVNDAIKWVREIAEITLDDHGDFLSATGTVQDISDKKQDEARIHQLAFFDSLTDLPNRSVLMEQLIHGVALAKREHYISALMLINIDRFKVVNDARGKAIGDALLQAFVQKLQTLVREGDVLARISGDEFALLCNNLHPDMTQASLLAQAVAESIQDVFKLPLVVEGEAITVTVTVSIGIALYPKQADDHAEGLLRQADTALHRAKAGGGNQIAFFETTMGDSVAQSFRIERELREALQQQDLRLYLQPQVDAQGKLVGAEVLVRWLHPERGLIPPMVFIPVAESSDLIVDVGKWVTIESCKLLAQQEMAGLPIRLSVNLSPRHFRQAGFVAWMKQVLEDTGADPTRLTLEITEGLMIDNVHDVIAKMSELHALGIHFSIDDFGTGYSSLAYIKRLPIQELKIDKAFVQDAPTDPNDAALVETILSVAEHLHLQVVAEGVETQEQADFLNARAKVIHQGYLFGKPEPAQTWINRWHEEHAI
jgi:diguanylate cyclase (GGDEF)-like protein/PAS domain S-box-containing protein